MAPKFDPSGGGRVCPINRRRGVRRSDGISINICLRRFFSNMWWVCYKLCWNVNRLVWVPVIAIKTAHFKSQLFRIRDWIFMFCWLSNHFIGLWFWIGLQCLYWCQEWVVSILFVRHFVICSGFKDTAMSFCP